MTLSDQNGGAIVSPEKLLSAREVEVARAYAQGDTYQMISERLNIAPSTVRTHLARIYRKLGVSTKLELRNLIETKAERGSGNLTPLLSGKPSIAVLPFENMTGDPSQDILSDGIAADIVTALSRSPWLFIIARHTAYTYKGQSVDVRRVSAELGVRFVLQGTLCRADDRVRITAELIDGLTGGYVWCDRYQGQTRDLFELRDLITRQVVASIQTAVQRRTIEEPVERQSRPDLTVWELTMRSWRLLYDFTPESYASARILLKRALAMDPDSAEANMVLSLIHHHAALLGFVANPGPAMEAAHTLARCATRLDPCNEYAQWALGISCLGLRRPGEGIAALETAVELNPNCSAACCGLGTALVITGRVEDAISHLMTAMEMNPRDPSIFFCFSGLSLAYYIDGCHDRAIEWASHAIHRMPRWHFAYLVLAASNMALGRTEHARAAADACHEALPWITILDAERLPLADNRMQELRTRLRGAGFASAPQG
ncbi:LuxR C-terminal-related transcriptional regulator [Defluviimonas sp. WL0002]|uniref:LuxR C-terminal-related transcriptional regulator n=1 Tax=Albidovulum marisflavi TaxID=2984159 RepID=A0ABT2ZDB1_9RHOB|nr:LuxR C-terminal-related transcriptional regulator [Defluviimonas sp. WL0002]MCV2869002.1 LuxR C-terminal-related transcriptional regulator [Defluviimonas sp. WL0002]